MSTNTQDALLSYSEAIKGGIALGVAFATVTIAVLAQSAFAGALVAKAQGSRAASFTVVHGAATIAATLIDEQLRFMHALSFATALPMRYTALLAQLKWSNFVVITKPFGTLSNSCKPPGSTRFSVQWLIALEFMGVNSPEAYFLTVTVVVGGVLLSTVVLHIVAAACFKYILRAPLPPTWSLPNFQARFLITAHSPVSLGAILILTSEGCAKAYTTAAWLELALVPIAFTVWVTVGIRSIPSRQLVQWTSPSSTDLEQKRLFGTWTHLNEAGARFKVRMGCLFMARRGERLFHLPLDIALQSARNVLMVTSPAGQVLAGSLLFVLEVLNCVGLLTLRPFNARYANLWRGAGAFARAMQVLFLFILRGRSAEEWQWILALILQVVILLLLSIISFWVSRGELVAARVIVAQHGTQASSRRPCYLALLDVALLVLGLPLLIPIGLLWLLGSAVTMRTTQMIPPPARPSRSTHRHQTMPRCSGPNNLFGRLRSWAGNVGKRIGGRLVTLLGLCKALLNLLSVALELPEFFPVLTNTQFVDIVSPSPDPEPRLPPIDTPPRRPTTQPPPPPPPVVTISPQDERSDDDNAPTSAYGPHCNFALPEAPASAPEPAESKVRGLMPVRNPIASTSANFLMSPTCPPTPRAVKPASHSRSALYSSATSRTRTSESSTMAESRHVRRGQQVASRTTSVLADGEVNVGTQVRRVDDDGNSGTDNDKAHHQEV